MSKPSILIAGAGVNGLVAGSQHHYALGASETPYGPQIVNPLCY
jgi:hypothetical protein